MKYFYVTRKESAGFVGLLTLDEILARLDTGELKDSFSATESDGRSFAQFRKSGDGRWRTLATLVLEAESGKLEQSTYARPARWLVLNFGGGELSGLLLLIGQVAALLTCAGIPFVVISQLSVVPAGSGFVVLVGSVLSFCLSAAMFIVYRRAKSVENMAHDQDAENQRLWRAIEELRGGGETPASTDDHDSA